jgi:hypothetical protein
MVKGSAHVARLEKRIEVLEREIAVSHAITFTYHGGCKCEICTRMGEK